MVFCGIKQFCGIKDIHTVAQPSPPSIFPEPFPQTTPSYRLHHHTPVPPAPLCPWQPPVYFLSMSLTMLSTSYKWSHTEFALLYLAYFTQHDVFKVHPVLHLTCVRISFLFQAGLCSIACIYHTVFIHSSIRGYLGCFHLLASVNTVAVNMVYTYLFKSLLSDVLGIYPVEELLDHMVIVIIWGTTTPFPQSTTPLYMPPGSAQGFQLLHTLTKACALFRFMIANQMGVRWYLVVLTWCRLLNWGMR